MNSPEERTSRRYLRMQDEREHDLMLAGWLLMIGVLTLFKGRSVVHIGMAFLAFTIFGHFLYMATIEFHQRKKALFESRESESEADTTPTSHTVNPSHESEQPKSFPWGLVIAVLLSLHTVYLWFS